jgi:2-amino-4-hydroxy-6-hydroxymethyldihydropteridine diphosphokinase
VTTAFIAFGSNLGNRLKHLRTGKRELEAHAGLISAQSRVFETEPVGGPDNQGAYLNAVVQLETGLSAPDLLRVLLEIERSRGRERRERWGPRTLDLDVLLYGDQIIHTPDLTVPHPRLHDRAFVLEPLSDLVPHLEIPGISRTVDDLRSSVGSAGVWATDLTF